MAPELKDHVQNTKNAIAELGLTACADLYERLRADELILIWNLHGKQVYRSANSLKYWSYTVDQLQSIPYYELFERDPEIDKMYRAILEDIVAGRVQDTFEVKIPTHVVREKRSKKRWRTRLTPRLVSPLRDGSHRVVAFVHTVHAEQLGPET